MKKRFIRGTIFGLGVLLVMANQPVSAHGSARTGTAGQRYVAMLRPENNSGVQGIARVTLDGNTLHVDLSVMGVEAGRRHPQHIHGFADKKNSVCAPPEADTNKNGIVELTEAQPYAGPVLVPFEPYPTPERSSYRFKNSITVDANSLQPLENRVVEVHGLTVNGNYDESIPVACGELVPVSTMGKAGKRSIGTGFHQMYGSMVSRARVFQQNVDMYRGCLGR